MCARGGIVALATVSAALALSAMAEVLTLPAEQAGATEPLAPRAVEPEPPANHAVPARQATRPVHEGPLRARCWQEGIKIIDQTDLVGLSLNAATRRDTVSFKRRGDDQPSVFLLPFADGLCLIQPIAAADR